MKDVLHLVVILCMSGKMLGLHAHIAFWLCDLICNVGAIFVQQYIPNMCTVALEYEKLDLKHNLNNSTSI